MSANRIVIVGASVAGGRAAETLRRSGYEGSIVLVGGEPHRPYDRPPLSKKFLRGQHPEDRLYLRPLAQYERLGIELVLGTRATALDVAARHVVLGDPGAGERRIDFDQLLIATGADVRRLACPGAALAGVHHVRTIEDATAIRAELAPGRRVVVIGAGVIGCEVAASCREEGLEVTMIEATETPLLRAFGEAVGRVYAEVHRARGVDLRTGATVTELRGRDRVESVVLGTGEEIACDLVVAGIGVRPATDWLVGSGVELDAGGAVLVDERCLTSIPGIWAAGDVARTWDPRLGRRTCVESIDNAQNQGVAAAQNMAGKDTVFAPVPFFWSDQYDLKLQSVGHVGACDRVVVRGSIADRAFTAFHLADGALAFAIGVNRMQEIGTAKKLIAAGITPTIEQLEDPATDLSALVPKKA